MAPLSRLEEPLESDYHARLEKLLTGQEFANLTTSPTFLSLQILKQLGIDIARNIMRREAFEQLGLTEATEEKLKSEDIDQDKLKEIIIREQEKLKKLFGGPSILLRLQQKLVNALLALYHLIGLGAATPEEIHRLIIKIAALHREIEVTAQQIEIEQRLYAEQEQKREQQIETQFLERIAEKEKTKEDKDHVSDAVQELGDAVSTILATPNAQNAISTESAAIVQHKTAAPQQSIHPSRHYASLPLEFILHRKNSLSNFPYNNETVPLQFEAKADTISNQLHLTETKSKDGHLFTFRHESNPEHIYHVNFKKDGVHFSTQSADSESLYILERIIKALNSSVEALELNTDWKIHAKDMTTGFKALTVLTNCGANLDNLAEIHLEEAIPVKPSEIATAKKEIKAHAESKDPKSVAYSNEEPLIKDPTKPRGS